MTSSSILDVLHAPQSARLRLVTGLGSSGSGWIPDQSDVNPWLQADLGHLHSIRAIVTQGCGDQFSWIEEYCVGYIDKHGTYLWYEGSQLADCKVQIDIDFL